jgi:hypothetical protein
MPLEYQRAGSIAAMCRPVRESRCLFATENCGFVDECLVLKGAAHRRSFQSVKTVAGSADKATAIGKCAFCVGDVLGWGVAAAYDIGAMYEWHVTRPERSPTLPTT